MDDPFGQTPIPWRQRLRSRPKYAPKPYLRIAGLIGPVCAFVLPFSHIPVNAITLVALFVLPPALAEVWWKLRRRRSDEELMPLAPHEPAPRDASTSRRATSGGRP